MIAHHIAYHPEKVNVVADALSRKSSSVENKEGKVVLNLGTNENLITHFQVKPTLEEEIVKL